ncbi:MAG TPA: alpha/beta fold hydrolase, partial [Actinomycetota bacterium]|nr:alpha/beta fold hydrolase [Actinomycetota bacterium]
MILAHEVAGSGQRRLEQERRREGGLDLDRRSRSGPARTAGWGPALLLVHAGIADRRMWDEQMGPARPVALWATLRDLLDHLGVERAVVVGSSLGGRAAVDLALAAPDRVRALVLIGSSLAGHPFQEPALFELWDQSEAAIERGDHQEAARVEIDAWVVGMGRDPSAVDPEVRRRVRDMLLVAYE